MAYPLLLLLFPLSLLPFSQPLSLDAAVEPLYDAGLVAMALTVNLTTSSLRPPRAVTAGGGATLFSPSDSAFAGSGQPPLALLRLHLVPRRLPLDALRSLPHGSKIPTSAPGLPLLVTTGATDGRASLNGVRINESAVFDDGSLLVYAADDFFDPAFQISSLPSHSLASPRSKIRCNPLSPPNGSLTQASEKLRSMGYSLMASFLDLQLGWEGKGATVFAAKDEVLGRCEGNFSAFLEVFRQHVVPCRLGGDQLADLAAGTAVPTLAEGFTISVDRWEGRPLLNGVPATELDLFDDGSIIVHGVKDALKPLESSVNVGW